MRVVDELVRQEGVQQRLDRRVRRRRIDQVGALHAHHVFVGQRVARAQLAQRLEPHRRQAGGLDRAHVPAGALHAQHVDVVAVEIGNARLHRGVAAAVQDELRDRRRAGASCRRAARDRARCRRSRSGRRRLAPRYRPTRFSSPHPRFDHQPKRRGLSSSAAAAGSGDATGSGAGGGAGGAGAGCTSLIGPDENIGAGSRIVERRRGGSDGAGGSARSGAVSRPTGSNGCGA